MDKTQTWEYGGGSEPELFAVVDKDELTPEWFALAYLLDDFRNEETGKSYLERFPDLAQHAIESSKDVREFAHYPHYELNGNSPYNVFLPVLKRHILLYKGLSGIHDTDRMSDSMYLLEKSLDAYVHHHTYMKRRFEQSPDYNPGYRRIQASVLEEVGKNEYDLDALEKAVKINTSIANSKVYSPLDGLKIHATFSNFDIADFLYGDNEALKRLGLPKTLGSLQYRFYTQLERVSASALAAASRAKRPNLEDVVGPLAETVFMGYMRELSAENDSYAEVGFSKSTIHQDTATPSAGLEIPSSSFDLQCYQRDGSSRVLFDVKKGSGDESKIPTIQTVKLHLNGYGPEEFVQEVRLYAQAMRKVQLSETLSNKERDVIEKIHSELDIEGMTNKSRTTLGRAVLGIIKNPKNKSQM